MLPPRAFTHPSWLSPVCSSSPYQSRTIRLPVHVVKEINLVLRAMRHVEFADGREVCLDRIAHLIDRSVDDVRRVMALNERISSLDTPLQLDPTQTVGDLIADENSLDPEELLQSNELGDLETDTSVIVYIRHAPLASPQQAVMDYLVSHEEITNSVARELTGIASENEMKRVFYSLRDARMIEPVPDKKGSKSAWRIWRGTEPSVSTKDAVVDEADE
jgi:hypothetical protein